MALRSRVVFLVTANGVNADVALGAIPFEADSVERSSAWELAAGTRLRTCSAEDLLVHKCFANRDRDWTDVEGGLASWNGHANCLIDVAAGTVVVDHRPAIDVATAA